MTDRTSEMEAVELTHSLLQCLLNMTGRTEEQRTPERESLARALHATYWNFGARWVVELTEGDIRTVHECIVGYTQNGRKRLYTRFHNYMCGQSLIYARLYKDKEAA